PPPTPFRPALLVIDMQNDFCPGDGDTIPDGALAVQGGRDIIPVINDLLSKPAFVYRVATRDWHPKEHISFAENHTGKRAFVDKVEVVHPEDPSRSYTTRLWPTHCVQHTPGAELVANLDTTKVDLVLDKGTDPRVEMYSAFYDPLRVEDSGLAGVLKDARAGGGHGETDGEKGITHVFVVGLAYDYCVRASALDARGEGFHVILVRDATRAVDPSPEKLAALEDELESKGVKVRGLADEEVRGWLG
ncbi:Isochorismatase hydrolase, partial [Schizophyllum commune Loenen D]